ncbi:hypothetical protein F511_23634 [Dorcoceras hygrometricum]|uniref:Dystroglycan-like n=1 Tax=Dorcoceras hygrometricum TaxID=472368 RepID=A0A2Z7AIK7_9LAMI|nr:hypothetical protein F511_23634 [Dorcoceras hygrometricum]
MASSLFVNTVHVCFESVLTMDNAGMVVMFESLVATGLKGFLGCPAVIHEAALLEFFKNGSVRDGLVVSTVNGVTVEISEQLFAETFELPVEGLTDLSEIPKDLVFDARSIVSLSGEPVLLAEPLGSLAFKMVQMRQLENEQKVDNCCLTQLYLSTVLALNQLSEMASSLFSNTLHVCFDSVLAMDNPGMVSMFEDLLASGLKGFLGCPAVLYEAALVEFFENASVRDGVVISTVGGKHVEISEELFASTFELPVDGLTDVYEIPKDIVFDARSIFSLSGEQGVPIQTVAPISTMPPSAPKRKIQKRKRRLALGSDDEIVEEPKTAGVVSIEDPVPADADVVDEGISTAVLE